MNKLRTWLSKEKRYSYHDLNTAEDVGGLSFILEEGIPHEEYQFFTGLKDKNGKEIYEGDIVAKDNTQFEIRFINGCFVLSYLPEKGFWLDIRSALEMMEGSDIHYDIISGYEIIGNIHENPQLLDNK
jgi:uncharacterized phage protein (TIGR01671 family)